VLIVILLSVAFIIVMPSVAIASVVMLSVVAPKTSNLNFVYFRQMVCQLRVKERTIFAIQQQAEGGLDAQREVP